MGTRLNLLFSPTLPAVGSYITGPKGPGGQKVLKAKRGNFWVKDEQQQEQEQQGE